MIAGLLVTHLAVCGVLVALRGRWRHRSLYLAAVPPALTTTWVLTRLGGDDVAEASWGWVPGLDLDIALAVGPMAELMTLAVSGVGFLVFVYTAGYVGGRPTGDDRLAATLLAFSASMLGLVWADSVWTLFLFWELTSVTSYLLVGHRREDPAAATAARRALIITVAGGLVLLAALLVLVDASGTARLGEMGPVGGGSGALAAVLILVAAATKSAHVPFHVWLPGAMAAPTPVSAYLHSATMVKAGVLLVALLNPIVGGAGPWQPLGLAFGVTSMIWGAVGALRHVDAKLILAWGTVSQLGLLTTMLAVGTPKAALAAMSLLAAHVVFKAALFMVVGEIDVRTGTRDITRLNGLLATMPTASAVAIVSGLSMMGVPPLLGFAAKEAAVEAVLSASGFAGVVGAAGVIGGSVLTVAYTLRLLVGMLGGDGEPIAVRAARPAMTVPSVVLGVGSILGFLVLGAVQDVVGPAALRVDAGSGRYELIRWPGPGAALAVSFAVVAAGAVMGWVLRRPGTAPRALGAEGADRTIDGILVAARRITGRVQHGSLPVYVVTMAVTVSAAASPFVAGVDLSALEWWDRPAQAVLGAGVVAMAVGAAMVGSRLGAALGLGGVGLGVTGLFAVHGAPDLVLTQILVETIIVVGFVVGLGALTRRFPPVGGLWRTTRIVASVGVAAAVMVGLAAGASSPRTTSAVPELTRQAVDEGGGNNVVNVILTDIRALDTLGEIVVLAVAAVGVLWLARASRTSRVAAEGTVST